MMNSDSSYLVSVRLQVTAIRKAGMDTRSIPIHNNQIEIFAYAILKDVCLNNHHGAFHLGVGNQNRLPDCS